MKPRFKWLKLLGASALAFGLATATIATAQVTATIDPASIPLGQSAQLAVTVTGNEGAQPVIPTVNGLEFTPVGQSSSFQSINGAITASVSLLYQVTPERPGTFTIPPIRLSGGASTPPLTLRVLSIAGGAPASPGSSPPPPDMQSDTDNGAANADGAPAFLRVILPKHDLYLGELVPVRIKAYFRAGMSASLSGLPVLSSDAFTLNKLSDKPEQTGEVIDGRSYTVLTWSSALAAVKTGDYALDLEMPVVVRERAPGSANPFKQFFGNSGFDDPAFDDSFINNFFGNVTEKQLTLHTDAENINTVSLPASGRPSDFSGAVGKFEVSSEATPAQLSVGDPITLRLRISGQGNFDRVYSRGLAASTEWKTYQPGAVFEPADNAGYGGTKTITQAIVPLTAGLQKIPALSFSYFDPDARQYVTRATTPISIEVAPGAGPALVAALPANPGTSTPAPSPNLSASELAPDKLQTGDFVSSLRPILFAPWFITLQGVPVMALIAGLLVHRRRQRLAHDPQWTRNRATQVIVHEQIAAMEQALASESAPAFFTAARQAVQERLAQCWRISAGEVTSAEIDRRLNGSGNELRTLFTVTDAVVYSGQHVPPADLKRWKDAVLQQLEKLEAS